MNSLPKNVMTQPKSMKDTLSGSFAPYIAKPVKTSTATST